MSDRVKYGAVGTVNVNSKKPPAKPQRRWISVVNKTLPGGIAVTAASLGASATGGNGSVRLDKYSDNKWFAPGRVVTVTITADAIQPNWTRSVASFDITMDYLRVQPTWTLKPEWTTGERVTLQTLGVSSNYRNATYRVVSPVGGMFTAPGEKVAVRVEVINDDWFRGVAPLVGTVKVVKAKPTIALAAPKAVAIGTQAMDAVVAATAPVPLIPAYAPAVLTEAKDVVVTATFAGNDRFLPADPATVTVKVMAKPVIAWATPAQMVVGGKLDGKVLNATIDPPGPVPDYAPPSGEMMNVVGDVTLTARFAGSADAPAADPKTVVLKVIKDKPKIVWHALPLIKNTNLQFTPQNPRAETFYGTPATVAWTFTPAANSAIGDVAELTLKAEFGDTARYEKNDRTLKVKVVGSLAEVGREGMLSGDGWKGPQSDKDKQLLKKWNEDDSEGGPKKSAQRMMTALLDKTSEELVEYMNAQIAPGTDGIPKGSYTPGGNNNIWHFPNGIQVRFKPNGHGNLSLPNPTTPMFCIEGKTSVGASGGDSDVAFKVTSDGKPGAYGKNQTVLPPGVPNTPSNWQFKTYMNAACGTTHLECKPKVEQTIDWANPPDITVGTNLESTLATVVAQDASLLEFFDGGDAPVTKTTVPALGANQTLKVKGKLSKRYLASAAAKTVTLNVNPKPQTIDWSPPTTQRWSGEALGDILNATASSGEKPRYATAGGQAVTGVTVLAVGPHRLIATCKAAGDYADAPPKDITVTVALRSQTITWVPPTTERWSGEKLGDILNATASNGAIPTYATESGQAVTSESELAVGPHKLIASASATHYADAPPKDITVTVALRSQTITWVPPTTERWSGEKLGDILNATASSGATPGYATERGQAVTGETVLAVGTHTLIASASAAHYADAPAKEITVTVSLRTQTIAWDPPTRERKSGEKLGDILNATATSGAAPSYATEGGQAVTRDTVLAAGSHKLIASARAAHYADAPPKDVTVTVAPPVEDTK